MITVASLSEAEVEFTGRGEMKVSAAPGLLSLSAVAGAAAEPPAPVNDPPTARDIGIMVAAASAVGRDAGIMVAAESAAMSTPQRAQRLAPGALAN